MKFKLASFIIICLASIALLVSDLALGKTQTLVIPGNAQGKAIRNAYVDELLHLIFKKQGLELDIEYNRESMSQGRALKELAEGDVIDLNWSVTTREREQKLLPIRIPIYQGLVGWRVFFIHRQKEQMFKQVMQAKDLRPLLAVQRFDWPDYRVLLANNLTVEGNISYDNMYKSVASGLADYFPRSVLEIVREKKSRNSRALMIEPSLLVKYPSAYYFFVNKNNKALASLIETGFNQAIADGSFERLFQRYHGEHLKLLNLEKRRVIELQNPYFPAMPGQH